MRKTFTMAFVFLAAAYVAAGQCTLGVEASPKPSGLRLGMTEAAMLKVFKAKRATDLGEFKVRGKERTFFIVTALAEYDRKKYTLPVEMEALDSLEMVVAGGRLSKFVLWHDRKKLKPSTVQEFADQLAEDHDLPAAWQFSPNTAKMECTGFAVEAAMTGEFSVTVR